MDGLIRMLSPEERAEFEKLVTVLRAASQNTDTVILVETAGRNPYAAALISGEVMERFVESCFVTGHIYEGTVTNFRDGAKK